MTVWWKTPPCVKMRYMRAWYDVFDANYEVDALPALSTCAKSFEEPIEFISLLDHNFPFISIMSLSMWLPMVYIYFFIWWWLHLTYNVRSWINEAMETNSCSMKHIFISELGIYFVFLCTCILCALYVLIKPYKHDLWINVEDMIFRCIW